MIPVLVLCMVLIAAFVLVPALTMKIMIFLGNAIRIFSFLLFGVAVFGIFMPKYAVVENALIEEMLLWYSAWSSQRAAVWCCRRWR